MLPLLLRMASILLRPVRLLLLLLLLLRTL
jgi:hypothetical protein